MGKGNTELEVTDEVMARDGQGRRWGAPSLAPSWCQGLALGREKCSWSRM
jgi:hypothetical protein